MAAPRDLARLYLRGLSLASVGELTSKHSAGYAAASAAPPYADVTCSQKQRQECGRGRPIGAFEPLLTHLVRCLRSARVCPNDGIVIRHALENFVQAGCTHFLKQALFLQHLHDTDEAYEVRCALYMRVLATSTDGDLQAPDQLEHAQKSSPKGVFSKTRKKK